MEEIKCTVLITAISLKMYFKGHYGFNRFKEQQVVKHDIQNLF